MAAKQLIKSISGIRGVIGGSYRNNLTPLDVVECTAGFGHWIKTTGAKAKVVVGRDGRISGPMVSQLAINTLIAMGIDVIDLGLSTTPTVEMAVTKLDAGAGIIFTASHNQKQWNALKFLNHKGEFISKQDGEDILASIEDSAYTFADVDDLGTVSQNDEMIDYHIDQIIDYRFVDAELIKSKGFHVVVDCINSTGAISIPPLLDRLGCTYTLLNEEVNGRFAHNPEPLPKHLEELSAKVVETKATCGISVDPDVDRLAFVCDDGSMFGEEYTLVAVADSILSQQKGNTVSNLSSTRALADVTKAHGGEYAASAVGEVNVVTMMKQQNAIIGGEGNGGIIVPDFHYGRDALIGIALFLTHLARTGKTISELKQTYPAYAIIKDKIALDDIDLDASFAKLRTAFSDESINEIDGLKIDFAEGWVHLRKSNTEPIARVYAEAATPEVAQRLAQKVKEQL